MRRSTRRTGSRTRRLQAEPHHMQHAGALRVRRARVLVVLVALHDDLVRARVDPEALVCERSVDVRLVLPAREHGADGRLRTERDGRGNRPWRVPQPQVEPVSAVQQVHDGAHDRQDEQRGGDEVHGDITKVKLSVVEHSEWDVITNLSQSRLRVVLICTRIGSSKVEGTM